MYRLIIIGLVCVIGSSGCAVHELHQDQDQIRIALLDLYTNQIMDNLIRAHNKMPIIQIDYTSATAMVTMKETAGVMDNLAATNAGVLTTAAAKTFAITKTTLNTLTGNGLLDHTNQVYLTATPVTATDAVYDAYDEFLSMPGSLQITCDPPPDHAAHLCKRCGKLYYWVPMEFQKAFLGLALTTTAIRAQPLAPPDSFYTANLLQVMELEQIKAPKAVNQKAKDKDAKDKDTKDNETKAAFILTIKLDKKIPVDTGYVDVSGGGKSQSTNPSKPADLNAKAKENTTVQSASKAAPQSGYLLILPPADEAQPDAELGLIRAASRSNLTDVIRVLFDENNAPSNFPSAEGFRQSLVSQPLSAKIYLRRHRPSAPTPNDAINRIEFTLQQIQLNQNRLGQ
jgi:hypothetical protein